MRKPQTANTISDNSSGNIQAGGNVGIPPEQHERMLRDAKEELRADLEAKFAQSQRADTAEREKLQLEMQILRNKLDAQYKVQLDPSGAAKESRERNREIEDLLDRSGNEIGGDRIAKAKAALNAGDDAKAKDIFEEIKARQQMAVQESARASYGLGEIAEAAIKWAEAAEHYRDAASLDPSYRTLTKAHEFTHRAGDYSTSLKLGEDLINAALAEGGQPNLAMAKNDHAITLQATGDYAKAEVLYREALEIDRLAIGEEHLDYATCLNNLALVVQKQGRLEEAEGLYLEALEIGRATLGEKHPAYATRLNNLAGVVQDQGRLEEAEGLFREALEIDRATIGKGHPGYAIHLNNLADVVQAQGRFDEAEGLFRETLEIGRATIGEGHPDYATRLNNLACLLRDQGKPEEARPMFEQALSILNATLPADHPHIATVESHFANLPPADAP